MRRLVKGLALVLAAVSFPSVAAAQYQYPPPPPYPYPQYAAEANLRIVVKPKEADVYVDGYRRQGRRRAFSGFTSSRATRDRHSPRRLPQPAPAVSESNATRKIEGTLEHRPGAPGPPPFPRRGLKPAPATHMRCGRRDRLPPEAGPHRRPRPLHRGHQLAAAPRRRTAVGRLQRRVDRCRFGFSPTTRRVLIDGERWSGPSSSDEQLIVQVREGRHHIEVRRDGFETFSRMAGCQAGQTQP